MRGTRCLIYFDICSDFSSFCLTSIGLSTSVVAVENITAASDVDEILGSLQEGLKQAEETMASILDGIVNGNALLLSELEDALTHMEDALTGD